MRRQKAIRGSPMIDWFNDQFLAASTRFQLHFAKDIQGFRKGHAPVCAISGDAFDPGGCGGVFAAGPLYRPIPYGPVNGLKVSICIVTVYVP